MLALYASTLFVSSALVFLIQPMYAKMVLPILGGTPAVWNTCILFFQATLLGGYVYSHTLINHLGVTRQAAFHMGLLLLPFLTLPIAIPHGWAPPIEQNPIPWLLILSFVSIGLPFFVLSTSAPMLQKWFANTNHPSARDPYFLYSASNAGSMLALLSYPTLIEPLLSLKHQSYAWATGYGIFALLTVSCAAMLWRSRREVGYNQQTVNPEASANQTLSINGSFQTTFKQRIRWVLWSLVPSSLLLGVTTHLTTNVTPAPLLWVMPLVLYLLTFILVFARHPILPHRLLIRALPYAVLAVVLSLLLNLQKPLWLLIALHLVAFFLIAMTCHGEIARSRPPTAYLTEFYLWISIGGVLGGVFNALVAPVVFAKAHEYPIALISAFLVQPHKKYAGWERTALLTDVVLAMVLGVLFLGIARIVKTIGVEAGLLTLGLTTGLPLLLCFSFRARPIRFGLGMGALLLASAFSIQQSYRILETERSFFGIYRVILDEGKSYKLLVHGNVSHGQQSTDWSRRNEPLLYYYATGPIGQLFLSFSPTNSASRVAIVGLGTGAIACYGKPGQEFTFFEIDPVIENIARNPRNFTYLRDCPPTIKVILGDARLSLRRIPDQHYGLIILDAFSSDAIPIHLLTREALELYLAKLETNGILAFHISNLYLDLKPVLGNLAWELGLTSFVQDDLKISQMEKNNGKSPSQWVVMTRQKDRLGKLVDNLHWKPLSSEADSSVWTDDFSNILSVIRWN